MYKPTLLLVDDEPLNLTVLLETLAQRATVAAVGTAGEALARLEQGSFDAVFAGHRAAGLDGVGLLEQAERIAPATARVLMSVYGEIDQFAAEMNRARVSHFLPKPIAAGQLRALLDHFIRQARGEPGPSGYGGERLALVLSHAALVEPITRALAQAEIPVSASWLPATGERPLALLWEAGLNNAVLLRIQQTLKEIAGVSEAPAAAPSGFASSPAMAPAAPRSSVPGVAPAPSPGVAPASSPGVAPASPRSSVPGVAPASPRSSIPGVAPGPSPGVAPGPSPASLEMRSLRERMHEVERGFIAAALQRHRGNQTRAARELGLSRQGLAQKCKKLGL